MGFITCCWKGFGFRVCLKGSCGNVNVVIVAVHRMA